MSQIEYNGERFCAAPGSTLLEATQGAKVSLRTGCRAGACGRCRVEVLYDTGVLSLPTEREIKCLRIIGVQNLAINRLACQARIANEGSIGLSQQGVKS